MSFRIPLWRQCSAVVLPSLLVFGLTACVESPDSFDTSTIPMAEPDGSDPHAGHGGESPEPEDPHAGHGGGSPTEPTDDTNNPGTGDPGSTPGGGTDGGNGGVVENPVNDFLEGQWGNSQALYSATDLATDAVIEQVQTVMDSAGNQFMSVAISSNFSDVSQSYLDNSVMVNVKPVTAATWTQQEPFPANERNAIARLNIVTDEASGKTLALWQRSGGEYFYSEFSSSGTTYFWGQPTQINLTNAELTVQFDSQGTPVFLGAQLDTINGKLVIRVQRMLQDGSWETFEHNHTLPNNNTASIDISKITFALDDNDQPIAIWSEQQANGYTMLSASLTTQNGWVESTVLASSANASIDLSQLANLYLLTSNSSPRQELIVELSSGMLYSLSRMTMDNGQSFMWHTPAQVLDGAIVSAASWGPKVTLGDEYALVTWGESDQSLTTTIAPDNSTTEEPIDEDEEEFFNKPGARSNHVGMNTLKSKLFSFASGWGENKLVANASADREIADVHTIVKPNGFATVGWVESSSTVSRLYTSHQLAGVWSTKEFVHEVNQTSSSMESPSLIIDDQGHVKVNWLQTNTQGFTVLGATSLDPVHIAQNTGGSSNGNDQDQGGGTPDDSGSPISATWGVAETLWTGKSGTRFYGPEANIDATGHSVVYLGGAIAEDSNNTGGEPLFYHQIDTAIWELKAPEPPSPNAKLLQYKFIQSSSEIYVLWHTESDLYFSRYVSSSNSWLAPEALGINPAPAKAYLMVDEVGMATVIWISLDSTNNTNIVNAKHYMPTTGWGQTMHTSIELSAYNYPPVISPNGTITFAWRNKESADPVIPDSRLHADLWTVKFDPAVGWSTHEQGLHLANFSDVDLGFYVLDDNMYLLTIYNNRLDSLDASIYMSGTGWGDPVNLDKHAGESGNVAGIPVVAVNDAGMAMVAWREVITSSEGNRIKVLKASRYSMASDWSEPVFISSNSTFEEAQLDLVLSDTGHAIASWVSGNLSTSMVHVNHFDSSTGSWRSQPEMLASYDTSLLNEVGARSPSIALNALDQAMISWDRQSVVDGILTHHIQAVINY